MPLESVIHVRVSKPLLKRLRARAKKYQWSVGQVARELIREAEETREKEGR